MAKPQPKNPLNDSPQSNVRELPKRPPQLLESRLVTAEFQRQRMAATPPAGTKPEQMLDPAYWAHVAAKIAPGAIIEVVPEDRSFFQELFVTRTAKHEVHCVQINFVSLQSDVSLAGLEAYEIGFAGASGRWRAVRKSDGNVIVNGLDTREAVVEQLRALIA